MSRAPAGINEDCCISSTVVNKNWSSGGLLGVLDLQFKNGQLLQSSQQKETKYLPLFYNYEPIIIFTSCASGFIVCYF